MLELIAEASKALSSWPVVNGFFIIVITFLALMMVRRGERERKNGGASNMEIPMYLMGGPVHDAMGALHDIAEECRTTNTILRDICRSVDDFNKGQSLTHKLLEDLRNERELRPVRRG